MSQVPMKIAVTGGAGNIAYSLLFRIAAGELFGKEESIQLNILEMPAALEKLEGVAMELEDCAFPLLKKVKISSDPKVLFQDIDFAILIGAKPRGPGMERKDLLQENGKIFVEQGKALNISAKGTAKVFVVGNPCNTNCLIAQHNAPNLSKQNFYAMTRLDQNRATGQLAKKSGMPVEEVTCMTIWGNHSSTQAPDFEHAKIAGRPAEEVIQDELWLKNDFCKQVQQRGAEIIKARGSSSAASAASAIIDGVRSLIIPTPENTWFSMGVHTEGNPYGIDEDLIFSFPCRVDRSGKLSIIEGLEISPYLKEKIAATQLELKEERDMVLKKVEV